MLKPESIKEFIEEHLKGTKLFMVDMHFRSGNNIELFIDSDESVSIDDCSELTRAFEERFDREEADYSLTVNSAGIGQPLKLYRQYKKLIGRPVEVILKSGIKVAAELRDATESEITLAYEERVREEGMKRPQLVERVFTYSLDEVKSTVEILDYS